MKISVCMATYNGEKYITEQVVSILNQIGENDELIISDDGSTDKTIDKLKEIGDRRIKIIFNNGKHGYTYNFENALKSSKGDIIFLSDQDDIWCSNKVSEVLKIIDKYDFIVHDCKTVDMNLHTISESRFEDINVKSCFISQMLRMRYLGCCMVFKRNVLDNLIPFPKSKYLVEHDTWIASFCELYYKSYMLDKKLILYRRHESNVSDAGEGKGYPLHIKILRRVYRLFCLFSRFPKVIMSKGGV